MSLYLAVSFIAAFAGSIIFVLLIRSAARRFGIMNHPNPIVGTHKKPVAYLGGAAVFLVFGISIVVISNWALWAILIAVTAWALVILGTIDDIRPLRWWIKLVCEFIIAGSALPFVFKSLNMNPHPLVIVMAVVFIVLLTNGLNIVDVADGLAGTIGICSSLGLFASMLILPVGSTVFMAPLILSAVLLGFLIFNWQPASIYLGDGGSLPLGYVAGVMIIIFITSGSQIFNRLLISFSLVSPVLFEIALVCFHRIKNRQLPFRGSPDHFALRLSKIGWKAPAIALSVIGVYVLLWASLGIAYLKPVFSYTYVAIVAVFYLTCFVLLSGIKVRE